MKLEYNSLVNVLWYIFDYQDTKHNVRISPWLPLILRPGLES